MKKHIGTVLMVVGILIIVVPLVGRYIATKQQQEMLDAYYLSESATSVSESDNLALDEVFASDADVATQEALSTETAVIEGNLDEASSELQDAEGTLKAKPNALGIVRIPKIDVVMPIAEGTTAEVLRYNVGHMIGTADLGEIGNSAIAGHRGHSFGVYFNRLDEITIGDEIIIETNGKKYTYVVYETLRVLPDDLSVLRGSSQYRVLTVITCDPVFNPTHRIIVHAVDKTQM